MEHVTNTYNPPWSHPKAIAISDTLFEIVLWTSIIAATFTAVFLFMLKAIPVPVMIQKIEDSKERTKRFRYYVGYILSWAHAPVTAFASMYFSYTNGITYCNPNSVGEKYLVYVSCEIDLREMLTLLVFFRIFYI